MPCSKDVTINGQADTIYWGYADKNLYFPFSAASFDEATVNALVGSLFSEAGPYRTTGYRYDDTVDVNLCAWFIVPDWYPDFAVTTGLQWSAGAGPVPTDNILSFTDGNTLVNAFSTSFAITNGLIEDTGFGGPGSALPLWDRYGVIPCAVFCSLTISYGGLSANGWQYFPNTIAGKPYRFYPMIPYVNSNQAFGNSCGYSRTSNVATLHTSCFPVPPFINTNFRGDVSNPRNTAIDTTFALIHIVDAGFTLTYPSTGSNIANFGPNFTPPFGDITIWWRTPDWFNGTDTAQTNGDFTLFVST